MKTKNKTILLLFIFVFIIIISNLKVYSQVLDNYEIVAENKFLILFLNKENTQFAVKIKETEDVWFSNPPASRVFNELISIEYYVPDGSRRQIDSYNHSVKYGQYSINIIENGFRLNYLMGRKWVNIDYLPTMISEERFEKLILDKIERENDKQLFLKNYELLSEQKTEAENEQINIDYIKEKDGSFDEIKNLNNNPTYVIKENVISWDINDMIDILKDIGYTPEDKIYDHMENNLDIPQKSVELFSIPLEVYLDNDDLVIYLPTEDISYPLAVIDSSYGTSGVPSERGMDKKIRDIFGTIEGKEEVDFPLHKIRLLPHFGGEGSEDEGYIFIPDGSGALINTNKYTGEMYTGIIYGDQSFLQNNINFRENIHLPLYGYKSGEKAFISIIEKGATQASIIVEIPRRRERNDKVFTEFMYIPKTNIEMLARTGRSASEFPVYQERPIEGDIQLRLRFLSRENANYVGMATQYRQYLIDKGILTRLEERENIPFYLELIGAISRKSLVMGLPRETTYPLTSFKDVKEIIEAFPVSMFSNLNLKYSGWLWGGLENIYPYRVRPDKSLGKEKEFHDLISFINSKEVNFYPDVDFLTVRNKPIYFKFNPRRDAARFIDQSIIKSNEFSLVDDKISKALGIYLSPLKLDNLITEFMKDYKSLGIKGLSLNRMGTDLYSDFQKGENLIDVKQSKNMITNQLEKLNKEKKLDLLIDGGNLYSLPYIKNIMNIPLSSSSLNIIDKEIPFYQIVIHGYINYAGAPFNLADNLDKNILKSLETGAYPYYLMTHAESVEVKNTDYNYLYRTYYQQQIERAVNMYHNFNEIFSQVYNQAIVAHQEIAKNVYQTKYENNVIVTVNYNNSQVMLKKEGMTEKMYQVLEEGIYEIP